MRVRRLLRPVLFLAYLAAYGSFIGVTVMAPDVLATPAPGGVNLAVAWGMGLILLAFITAIAALAMPEEDR
ncbi:MAG: DUF485 domain-containing protein [Phycisphaerales bacterium]|nr:DUF485 domain-containing protein [Phycisphaerales bacterium]